LFFQIHSIGTINELVKTNCRKKKNCYLDFFSVFGCSVATYSHESCSCNVFCVFSLSIVLDGMFPLNIMSCVWGENSYHLSIWSLGLSLILIVMSYCILFQQRVHFHNTGPSSVPGVIVMSIEDARNDRHEMAQIDKT
jgi:hypothetical protein